jgi:phage recombination protein Bet
MTTAIQHTNGASVAQYNREAIETIKATVAKGATDAELEMFLHLAARYGLDPFAKEIWCTKYVKQGQDPKHVPATIIVSRDGYLKAAQQDPDFDGIASGTVREGDLFAFNPVAGSVSHEFGTKRGQILGAWAVVHHKRRRPVACFADFTEYRGNSPIWSNYPSAMIQKVAEVHALKRQFGLSGIVSKEEMDYQPIEDMPAIAAPASVEVIPAPVTRQLADTDAKKDDQGRAMASFWITVREAAQGQGIPTADVDAVVHFALSKALQLDSLTKLNPVKLKGFGARLSEPGKFAEMWSEWCAANADSIPGFDDVTHGEIDGDNMAARND